MSKSWDKRSIAIQSLQAVPERHMQTDERTIVKDGSRGSSGGAATALLPVGKPGREEGLQ